MENDGSYHRWLKDIFGSLAQTTGTPTTSAPNTREADRAEIEMRWMPDKRRLLHFLTRMCRDARTDLAGYSEREVGGGLWYLLADGDFFGGTLRDIPYPAERSSAERRDIQKDRVECIRSTYFLFTEALAPRLKAEIRAPSVSRVVEWWWEFFPKPNPTFTGRHYDELKPLLLGESLVPLTGEMIAESQEYYDEVLTVMETLLKNGDKNYWYDVYQHIDHWREPTGHAKRLEAAYSSRKP